MRCWRSYCAVGVPADDNTVVAGLPSAVDAVMYLLSQLLLAPLHAVADFTVFARIPAFDSVHTVLAVLLLLSVLLLLAFLLFLSNMLLLAVLLLLAFLLLTAFLLLLASLLILVSLFSWGLCRMRRITLSDYQNMAIRLKIFSAIKLSEYRISYWRIQETIGLSDIGSRSQSIGLSDIGLRKNYRLLDSARLTKKK